MLSGFLAGFIGSVHCAVMCGPLSMAVNGQRNFLQQLIYNSGRLTTYVLLGVTFGLLGRGLSIFGWQQGLSVIMGIVVIIFALFPRYQHKLLQSPMYGKVIQPLRKNLQKVLKSKNPFTYYVIGMLNGLLPCGLVYMVLSVSVATGTIQGGALVMLGFGLGTWPMMFGITRLLSFIKGRKAFSIQYVIPALALVMGALLILRGLSLNIPYVSPVVSTLGLDWGLPGCSMP
ncbi:sulfite exporter TauE/SafE family protein [Fulvivirga sediminis]|uniref:Sulfite exporter TauE/SafE family protein n=1 Tax=Fulvivirga sediminis TaxID=2803949 RepID=A0A937F3Z9_9BACT|nr:sulfite exporter TauE/SafE family protein [Fulvivirga sediminis]MBL3655926.1 sulfite exporter TauE/SafE family protein [Fulvivirga sediminis]